MFILRARHEPLPSRRVRILAWQGAVVAESCTVALPGDGVVAAAWADAAGAPLVLALGGGRIAAAFPAAPAPGGRARASASMHAVLARVLQSACGAPAHAQSELRACAKAPAPCPTCIPPCGADGAPRGARRGRRHDGRSAPCVPGRSCGCHGGRGQRGPADAVLPGPRRRRAALPAAALRGRLGGAGQRRYSCGGCEPCRGAPAVHRVGAVSRIRARRAQFQGGSACKRAPSGLRAIG